MRRGVDCGDICTNLGRAVFAHRRAGGNKRIHRRALLARGAAQTGNALRFNTYSTDTGGASADIGFSAPAGACQQFTVILAALGNPAAIARINFQDRSGATQAAFFVDDLDLISGSAGPTPTLAGGPTLGVDMSAERAPISPLIYGMNYAEEALAADLDLPVRRWGGNATTRYNWLTDVASRGSDWYFENIKETDPFAPDCGNCISWRAANQRRPTARFSGKLDHAACHIQRGSDSHAWPAPTPTLVGTPAPTQSAANLTKRAWVPVVTR